jgi:hypothetical protein
MQSTAQLKTTFPLSFYLFLSIILELAVIQRRRLLFISRLASNLDQNKEASPVPPHELSPISHRRIAVEGTKTEKKTIFVLTSDECTKKIPGY